MEGERTSEAVVIPDISEPLTNETEEHGTLSSEQHHSVAPIAVPVASVPVSLPVGVDLIGVASAGATFNVITPDQLQLSSGGHYKPVLCVDNSFICDARNDKDAETIRTWVRNAQATHIVIQGEPLVSSAEVSPASGAVTGSTTPGTTLNSPTTWNESVHLPVLPVRCKNTSAELHKAKFGSGGRGRCIKLGENWYTPSEFEAICGRASSKDWKRSIRFGGRSLQTLVDEAILTPHATSCTCSACCDDDTATGPVRLFTPYKRRKRKNTDEGSHKMKRSSSKDNNSHSNDEESESDVRGAGDDWESSPLDQRSPGGGNGGGSTQSSQLPVTTSPPSTFSKSQLSDMMVVTTASSDLVTQSSSAVSNGSRLAPSPSQGGASSSGQRTDANQNADSICAVTAKHSEVFKRLEEMAAKILKMSYQFRSAIEEAKDHFQSEIEKLKKESEQAILTARVEAQAAREALEQRDQVQVVDSLDTVDLHPSTDSEAKKCANCNRDALAECSLCRRTPYCSTFCQRKDWSSHQMECVRAVTTVATTADHAGNIMLIVKSTDQVLTADNITHSDG